MADSRLFRLRVVFQKAGRLSLLSHLEVARALERAVRRARLPFAVSNGFSPHMRIAFGAALPVGVGGLEEFFDLFLSSYLSAEKALSALQNVSVEGLYPLRCYYVENDAPSASSAFPLSTYEASLSCDVPYLLVPETVKVTRKKKERVLCVEEFLVGAVECAACTSDKRGADGGVLDKHDADVRASDKHGAEGDASDKRGADVRTSDKRGADVRASDKHGAEGDTLDKHGADVRASDKHGAEGDTSDKRGADVRASDKRGADGGVVRFTLEAKQTGSLRPDVFLNACLADTIAANDAPVDTRVLSIMRTCQRNAAGDTV